MMRYFARTVAASQLILMSLFATSKIGEKASCEPITWGSAWFFVLVCASLLLIGYVAGRESEEKK